VRPAFCTSWANRDDPTATDLARDLSIDPGYVSRILRKFHDRGLIDKRTPDSDARQTILRLTPGGRKAFAPLDLRSAEQVGQMLSRLSQAEQDRLLDAMHTIQELQGHREARAGAVDSEPHHSFGKDLVGETWELALTSDASR
jgi:DNA-binding MarR family transcriptional regulator